MLGFGLAGLTAMGLLSAPLSEVRAETVCVFPGVCAECTRPQPGTICCTSPLGYTCEPDPNYHGEEGSPSAEPPGEPEFDATTRFQIQPLNCPRGFARVGETFYGGTQCAPKIHPRPAAVKSPQAAVAPRTTPTRPPQVQPSREPKANEGQTTAQTVPTRPLFDTPDLMSEDIESANWAHILAARRQQERSPALDMAAVGAIAIVTGAAIAAGGGLVAAGVGAWAIGAVALYHYWPRMTGPAWTF